MLKIDNNLLVELGLGALPDGEKNSLLKHIYETLEMRVGMRLADQMSNQQLDEFEQYFEAKDDAGAFKWLETNFPNYKDIVQEEFDKLKAEVGQSAPQILGASQQAQTAVPQAAPQPVVPGPGTTPADQQYQPEPSPMQGPNTQAPADFSQGVPPQAAPAPAQPYAAPPQPAQDGTQPLPYEGQAPTSQPPAGPGY